MMKFRALAFVLSLVCATFLQAQEDTCSATPETIGEQIGNAVTFCGTPAQVIAPEKVKGDPVYLNFGGNYPNHLFTVVIWSDIAGDQRDQLVRRYAKAAVRVKGTVSSYRGKPQIVLRSMDDISLED